MRALPKICLNILLLVALVCAGLAGYPRHVAPNAPCQPASVHGPQEHDYACLVARRSVPSDITPSDEQLPLVGVLPSNTGLAAASFRFIARGASRVSRLSSLLPLSRPRARAPPAHA